MNVQEATNHHGAGAMLDQTAPLAHRPSHVPPERVVDFDVHTPPHVERGFHAAWKALQNSAPDLVWTPRNGGHWILTRGKDIHAAFADYERFSSKIIFVPKSVGETHVLPPGTYDPPEHNRYRTILNDGMSFKAMGGIANIEATIRTLASSLIEGFRTRGNCSFTREFAEILPIHLFLRLSDLPLEDAPKLKYWAEQVTRMEGEMSVKDAIQAFRDYLGPYVDARTAQPGQDLISRMITARTGEQRLSKPEVLELAIQVLSASLDTVVNFLGFSFHYLAEHPQQRQLLRNNEHLARAVEELFRRFPLITIGRLVVKDTNLLGVELKAGEMIVLPSALHGLDERENTDPLQVNFERPALSHSTFGNGPHRCPGSNLARIEVRIAIEEWLQRIPEFEVQPDAPLVHHGGVVGSIQELSLRWPV